MTLTKKHTQYIFIASLALLILNDFYLKQAFHNTITGKLSDFAGLLIFPWFWSLFFKQSRKLIYFGTVSLFILWKSELSTTSISVINEFFGTSFNRVVDFTDLLALSILPLSYKLSEASDFQTKKYSFITKWLISGVTISSFIATSQAELNVNPRWEFDEVYQLPFNKKELLTNHMQYKFGEEPDPAILSQSEFEMEYFSGTYSFYFLASVSEIDSINTQLTLRELIHIPYLGLRKREIG